MTVNTISEITSLQTVLVIDHPEAVDNQLLKLHHFELVGCAPLADVWRAIDLKRPDIILINQAQSIDLRAVALYLQQIPNYQPNIYIAPGFKFAKLIDIIKVMDNGSCQHSLISLDDYLHQNDAKKARDKSLGRELVKLGCPITYCGYEYLIKAIEEYMIHGPCHMRELHSIVAKHFGKKDAAIERGIRATVEACKERRTEYFNEVFEGQDNKYITSSCYINTVTRLISGKL